MKESIDRILETAGRVADTAVKATAELVEKGKDKVDQSVLQNRLAKAQRQLGELVYILRKTGETNEPMITHYMDQIERIKKELALYENVFTENETKVYVYENTSEEEGKAQEGATFCCGDRNELP